MKKSRKILIERYVELRCKHLQEGRELNEWEWGDVWDTTKNVGKGLTKMAWNLSPPGMAYNAFKRGAGAANDIQRGADWKDVLGNVGNMYVDDLQSGLDVLGMIPAAGIIPDAINMGVSGVRAGIADNEESKNKHLQNLALSTAAAIPGFGLAAGAGKIGKTGFKLGKAADTAAGVAKPILKTAKYPLKTAKNTIKASGKGASGANLVNTAANTAITTDAPGGKLAGRTFGQGPFTSLYNAVKDPIANAFDFSDASTYNADNMPASWRIRGANDLSPQ